jgi:hypothetical protein
MSVARRKRISTHGAKANNGISGLQEVALERDAMGLVCGKGCSVMGWMMGWKSAFIIFLLKTIR